MDKKFTDALSIFAEKYKKNPDVIGILLSGSHLHSKPDKNSDLDVFIVLKNGVMRERGNTFVNGVEIEYFMNPVKKIKEYFKEEAFKKKENPATVHMFANSQVIYKKGNELEKLIKEAKKLIKKPLDKMKQMDLEIARYHIDDMRKDLEDVYLKKDWPAFNLTANAILDAGLKDFFKIKRMHKEKNKRLMAQLNKIDAEYAKVFSSALLEANYAQRYRKLNQFVNCTEKILRGARPKEWILRSKCTYLKKK